MAADDDASSAASSSSDDDIAYSSPDDDSDNDASDDDDDGNNAFVYNIQPKEFSRKTTGGGTTKNVTASSQSQPSLKSSVNIMSASTNATGRKREKANASGLSSKKKTKENSIIKKNNSLLDSDDEDEDDEDWLLNRNIDSGEACEDGETNGSIQVAGAGLKKPALAAPPPPPPPPARPPKPAEPDVVINLADSDDDDDDDNKRKDDDDDNDRIEILESINGTDTGGVRRSKRQACNRATAAGRSSKAAAKVSSAAVAAVASKPTPRHGKTQHGNDRNKPDDSIDLSSDDDDDDNDIVVDPSKLNLPPEVAAALARTKESKNLLSKAQKYHAHDIHVNLNDAQPLGLTSARRNVFFSTAKRTSSGSTGEAGGSNRAGPGRVAAGSLGGAKMAFLDEDEVDYGPTLTLKLREIRNRKAGDELELKTKLKRHMSVLFDKFYEERKLSLPHECVFKFDGEKLNPMKTPQDYDMEDDDIIDVEFP